MKVNTYISTVIVDENLSRWQLGGLIGIHKLKTHYLKKVVGESVKRKTNNFDYLQAVAKLLVFSELAKLISNF